jgi:hypothetical protein
VSKKGKEDSQGFNTGYALTQCWGLSRLEIPAVHCFNLISIFVNLDLVWLLLTFTEHPLLKSLPSLPWQHLGSILAGGVGDVTKALLPQCWGPGHLLILRNEGGGPAAQPSWTGLGKRLEGGWLPLLQPLPTAQG